MTRSVTRRLDALEAAQVADASDREKAITTYFFLLPDDELCLVYQALRAVGVRPLDEAETRALSAFDGATGPRDGDDTAVAARCAAQCAYLRTLADDDLHMLAQALQHDGRCRLNAAETRALATCADALAQEHPFYARG